MAADLSHLETLSKAQLVNWLRNALLGKVPLPRSTSEEGIRSILANAESKLSRITRRDLESVIISLIKELKSGSQRPIHYVEDLVGLASDLKIVNAVQSLLSLADAFVSGKAKLAHAAFTAVLFAIIDLRIPQPESFWLKMWKHNQRDTSSAVVAALLDRDPMHAIEFLPKIGNSQDLADVLVMQLDYHADQMEVMERRKFLNTAATIAKGCKSHLKSGIMEWLEDIGETSLDTMETVSEENQLLFRALGQKQEMPYSARLCGSA